MIPLPLSDLRGLAQLLTAATLGAADLAEQVHDGVGHPRETRSGRGLKGRVYGAIRGLAAATGGGVDAVLSALEPMGAPEQPSARRDALRAALNGVLGDRLAADGNPLALPMTLRHRDADLELESVRLREAFPGAGPHLLVLVHGLCRNDRHWTCGDHDHGAALARSLGCTPLYLRCNSGRHVSENGRDLANLLEQLVDRWPVPVQRLTILAHSLGGLVARSAAHQGAAAGHGWPAVLRELVFLGTPHHGAPLERAGSLVDGLLEAAPFTLPFARLGRLRSAGITDLRRGNLLEEDWRGRDRFARGRDRRTPVPLPAGVRCCAVAGLVRASGGVGRLVGDGLVPLDSALGRHRDPARDLRFPADRTWVGEGLGHLDLLSSPEVHAQLQRWLGMA